MNHAVKSLIQDVAHAETRLRVATAKASGALQLYAEQPSLLNFDRTLEFLCEAEAQRMELTGMRDALSRLESQNELVELTASGAAAVETKASA